MDFSSYEGFEVQGWSEIVLSRGRVVVEDGNLLVEGGGKFIMRARHGELLRQGGGRREFDTSLLDSQLGSIHLRFLARACRVSP